MNSSEVGGISVLVVDDEELLARSCSQILAAEGYSVRIETRGHAAVETVRRHRPDIVLTDLRLPDFDGIALLKEIRQLSPETLVVMITGFATVNSSVEALQAGAYDYIPKPFTAIQLRILIGRAAQQVQLARDNAQLRDELKRHGGSDGIVGTSQSIRKVLDLVARVAPTDASVFVAGESGTGKELIARAIHVRSRRSDAPFVAINCAALPEQLLESELFGHEKGSFTGADGQRRGLIEAASGGTFFLDEISEMSLDLQAKLLRVVQERKVRSVGGEKERSVDIRWISATNRDPEAAVRDGQLRQDLFFRLNVVPIRVPKLDERKEDISLLAQHFLKRFAEQYGRTGLRLSPTVYQALQTYSWPGNVRELQNVIERMVSLSGETLEITTEDLPDELLRLPGIEKPASGEQSHSISGESFHAAKTRAVAEFEQRYIRDLLARSGGNISQAARDAGIDRKTIHRMLTKYQLEHISG
ncbi:sigma-54 dependent transcriptional regulator [soil metagenome]